MRHTVLIALALLPLSTLAADEFVVRDMRVEGLQRISEGTVFNYLPVNVGDTIDQNRIGEAIRALYGQEMFDDIEVRRDGDTLVIVVRERPSIESFDIEGNKDIKTEDLMDSLRSVGLARGRTFNRSVLDNVEMFLREQYYDRGKYGVVVESNIQERPNNTVRILVNVKEGDRAKIRQVNIVGNEAFEEDEIRADFELDTANWLSWIRQDDRYAKESLEGDLETLRSFYMDRGYADFKIESTQVAISPNKEDIFVTINIDEGEVYTISDVKLVGEMVISEVFLRGFVLAQPGSIFNQNLLTRSAELMTFRLGEEGYSNAEIEPVPELDHETKEAEITFYINPQNRVYVRNINFNGVNQVDDEVLRREMRQMEGSYLSNRLVDRSKILLQRLPYVVLVEVENEPVPGSPDLVDVNFDVEYRMPGQFSGGIGYSESHRKPRCVAAQLGSIPEALQRFPHRSVSHHGRRQSHDQPELPRYHAVYVRGFRLLYDERRRVCRLRLSDHRIPAHQFRRDIPALGVAVVDQQHAAGAGLGGEQRQRVRRANGFRRHFLRHGIRYGRTPRRLEL